MAERLGSYNDFLEQHGLEHGPDAIDAYSVALQGLRIQLAADRGVDLDELHRNPNAISSPEAIVAA